MLNSADAASRRGMVTQADCSKRTMKTDELREKYLSFFETKGCVRRPSDVLVPRWDPSVLFTPAGMNQFKDHFLGRCKLEFTRATTCQKCLRTGDIDNVGRTAYHHTFFEMLGNFSFGDYFKREAIHWALGVSHRQEMAGAGPGAALGHGLSRRRRGGRHLGRRDRPAAGADRTAGRGRKLLARQRPQPGPRRRLRPVQRDLLPHADFGEVEIWNLVFTQFNRVGPPPNNLRPLPSKNIDTGMGLERTAAVLQGVETELPHRHPRGRWSRRPAKSATCATSRKAKPAAGCGGSPTTCGPAPSPSTRTSIPARTRKSTSSSGCCAAPCWTAIRWASASPSSTSWSARWPR